MVPSGVDGRTKLARRIKSLANAFAAELGHKLSPAQIDAVRRAAQMSAIAEDCRARLIAGDVSVTLTDVVRLDGTARRAVRDLHLPPAKDNAPDIDALFAEITTKAAGGVTL